MEHYPKALYRYKAFSSYSHGVDTRLAPALRPAVFRDETSLAVTPALWPSIEAALLDSEYFLLLASPDAAASKWVQDEVACWLDHRPADHLLIALTRGEIRWNATAQEAGGSLRSTTMAVWGMGRPSGRRNRAVTANQSARAPTIDASAAAWT